MSDRDLFRMRAYAPIEGRQQRIDRAVTTADEIRVAIEDAIGAGLPLNLRLAVDIEVDSPITLPSTLVAVEVNGGGRAGFMATATLASVLVVDCNTTTVAGCSFRPGVGSLGALFSTTVQTAPILDKRAFTVRDLVITDAADLLDPAARWQNVDVRGLTVRMTAGVMSLRDAPGGGWHNCRVAFLNGPVAISLKNGSSSCSFIAVRSFGTSLATVDTTGGVATGSTRHQFIGCTMWSFVVRDYDVVVMGQTGDTTSALTRLASGLSVPPRDATIFSGLSVAGSSYARIAFDASSSGSVTITDGMQAGQLLVLEVSAVDGTASFPASAPNLSLRTELVPTSGATLLLIWNGTKWVELARGSSGSAANVQLMEGATTSATAVTIGTIATRANRSYLITLDVVGRQTNSVNESAAYKVLYKLKNNAGALTLSAATVAFRQEDVATWLDPVLVVAGTTVLVQVAGAAAMNVSWRCYATIEESV